MGEFRQQHSMSEMDIISMEMTKQSSHLNSTLLENFSNIAADFSLDTLFAHQLLPQFPPSLTAIIPTFMVDEDHVFVDESKKRKSSMEQSTSSNYHQNNNISPAVSTTTEFAENTNVIKGKKARKGNEKAAEKAKEVIHVRARRGQATDSHSLAERVRREKINEKMRFLQDLVPGCQKTMGMAVMLDEIINYVHSLQNQVEFLSMELAAASSAYDLNLETTECIKKAQGTNSHVAVAQQMEKWARDRYGEENCFGLTWPL